MKSLEEWLAEYAESHRHPVNVRVHIVCVPVIVLSLFGIFSAIPAPIPFVPAGAASLMLLGAVLYYLRLSWRGALYLGIMGLAAVLLLDWLQSITTYVLHGSVLLFVAAWIGQFWGHKVEGKKPSFLEDLAFLMIGPLFVLRHLGVRL